MNHLYFLFLFSLFVPFNFSQTPPTANPNHQSYIQTPLNLEAYIGNKDFEFLYQFNEDDPFREMAKAVGRMEFTARTPTGDVTLRGTGFFISDQNILTCYHVPYNPKYIIEEIIEARIIMDRLKPNYASQEVIQVDPKPFKQNQASDYIIYTIKDTSQKRPPLKLSTTPPANNESIYIIHHPLDMPLTLSRRLCFVTTHNTNDLLHTCDTLEGSSGAPIISSVTHKVIGLHQGALSDVNIGISITRILNESIIRVVEKPTDTSTAISTVRPESLIVGKFGIKSDFPFLPKDYELHYDKDSMIHTLLKNKKKVISVRSKKVLIFFSPTNNQSSNLESIDHISATTNKTKKLWIGLILEEGQTKPFPPKTTLKAENLRKKRKIIPTKFTITERNEHYTENRKYISSQNNNVFMSNIEEHPTLD